MYQAPSKVSILAFIPEPIVRVGLTAILATDQEFELVGLVDSDSELISSALKFQPAVILYRLRLELNLSLIQGLRRAAPRSGIVLWGHELSTEMASQAMGLRVRGLLSTTCSPDTLKECLRISASDQIWMEQSLSTALLSARPVSLSKRQSQILSLIAQGLKNKEIASRMGISESTVKSYLTKLFDKVGAKDRFELAVFGLKNLGRLADSVPPGSSQSPRPLLRNVLVSEASGRTVA